MINNLARHVWLVDLVGSSNGITFREINSKWKRAGINPTGEELPLRTFNNWKVEIVKEFGINFFCDRHTNRYYIRRFDDMKGGALREWMINAFTISNMLSEREALSGRIILENVPSGQRFLKSFVDAMKDNQSVRFTYTKFTSGDTQQVTLEPYCVKLYERRWYVLGRNVEKNALRTYALDRVVEVGVLPEIFRLPATFSADDYYQDCFGVIHDDNEPPVVVRLRVQAAQCDYYRSLPLHSSQEEVLTTDEYSEFRMFVRPTFDFIQQLLAQREYTEVLEPLSLREKMKDVITEMLRNYQ